MLGRHETTPWLLPRARSDTWCCPCYALQWQTLYSELYSAGSYWAASLYCLVEGLWYLSAAYGKALNVGVKRINKRHCAREWAKMGRQEALWNVTWLQICRIFTYLIPMDFEGSSASWSGFAAKMFLWCGLSPGPGLVHSHRRKFLLRTGFSLLCHLQKQTLLDIVWPWNVTLICLTSERRCFSISKML